MLPGAPVAVQQLLSQIPNWLVVQEAASEPDPRLAGLDIGEGEAIVLTVSLSDDLVLLDEARGQRAAGDPGLVIAGTLGVLDRAGRDGSAAGCGDCRDIFAGAAGGTDRSVSGAAV